MNNRFLSIIWGPLRTVVLVYRSYCTYSGLSIQVLLYIQWPVNTGPTVHTVASQYRVSQYRSYCIYSGLSIQGLLIQVLLYIQWSLNTGPTVHTVASQYRSYCTYSGLSIQGLLIQVLLYIQWSLNMYRFHALFQYLVWCNYKMFSQFFFCSGKEDAIVCGVVLPVMVIMVVVVILLMVIIVFKAKQGCSKLVHCLFICTHRCI